MKKAIKLCTIIFMVLLTTIEASCKKPALATPAVNAFPVLTSADASTTRTLVAGSIRFNVNLNKAGTSDASAKYTLVAGTALSPRDFTATTGSVTIAAGKTQAFFDVTITGDSLRQPNLQFTVMFSDAKNCTLGAASYKGTIITMDGTYLPTDTSGYSTPASYPGYTLAWSDEFSGASINTNDWNFEVGNNGWGNHELENYTGRPQNAFLSNGMLVIEARAENFGGSNYTSARMTTQSKKTFKFGRIDIRAKLPVNKGMWPALWMLGSNINTVPWPACGETDIMELVGLDPKKVLGTAHFVNNAGVHDSRGGNYSITGEDFSQKFHVFSLKWVQDSIQWLVDDQLYFTMTSATAGTNNYPFNNSSFFIFNVAVGGDWPGPPDGTTNFPQRMFVDYVRVFQ